MGNASVKLKAHRLWRALGGQRQATAPSQGPPAPRCGACVSYGGSSRARAECSLRGVIVSCLSIRPGCFRAGAES